MCFFLLSDSSYWAERRRKEEEKEEENEERRGADCYRTGLCESRNGGLNFTSLAGRWEEVVDACLGRIN